MKKKDTTRRKLSQPMSRGENMRRIKSKNTQPEVVVRRLLRDLGHGGYRLHRKDIIGCPDIAFIGKRKVIFVHGCFWHGHNCKVGIRKPKSNQEYWLPKIERNCNRDIKHAAELEERGWSVLTVWECQLSNMGELTKILETFMRVAGG